MAENFLDSLSPEEKLRYYLYARSKISPELIGEMTASMLPPSYLFDDSSNTSISWSLSASAKSFVVQLAEEGECLVRS